MRIEIIHIESLAHGLDSTNSYPTVRPRNSFSHWGVGVGMWVDGRDCSGVGNLSILQ